MKTQSASYINGIALSEMPRSELEHFSFSNSAFLWGDSAFTSGLIKEGRLTLWTGHRARLISSCDWLYGDHDLYEKIEKKIFDIIKTGHQHFTGKFRVTFFYEGASKLPCWTLDLSSLSHVSDKKFVTEQVPFTLNRRDTNVKIGSYADVYQLKRQFEKLDICLVNDRDEIIEGMHSALLFWHKDKSKWLTPLTTNYKLKSIGLHYGFADLAYSEEKISASELSDYSAAFSINAVYKAVPITQINDIKFPESKERETSLINMWSEE